MRYLTYLFDLDGTLYNRDILVQKVVLEQQREFQGQLAHVEANYYVERIIELDAHGYFPKDKLYAQIAQEFGLTRATESKLIDHFWDCYNAHCILPEDTLTTLQTLYRQGVQLGLVTNGKTQTQNKKIDTLGIRDYFDVILISEAEGIKKPHPDIFHRAVEQCDHDPAQTVFVGDHPIADIDGARDAGLAAIWKRVPYWEMLRTDVRVVENLVEILI